MLHIAVALLFLLMILAPCVIAWRSRSREDAQELRDQNALMPVAEALELPEPALPIFDIPVLPALSAPAETLTGLALTDLEEAMANVKLAQAVAQRANLAVRDALARVAIIRAAAAAVSARDAERAAAEAARLAQDADAIYHQMLARETRSRDQEIYDTAADHFYDLPHDPRKAA